MTWNGIGRPPPLNRAQRRARAAAARHAEPTKNELAAEMARLFGPPPPFENIGPGELERRAEQARQSLRAQRRGRA